MITRNRPFIIEFTGPPNSGKTTIIQALKPALEAKGLKVEIKQEDAELVPKYIPKKTWIRNAWIAFGQLQGLIEAVSSDCDIVLLDRGFFDALFWVDFLEDQNVCTESESFNMKHVFYDFNIQFKFKPDVLFVIDVSTEESLRRRYADSSEESPVLSTDEFINNYKKVLDKFISSLSLDVTCHKLDTSLLTKDVMTNKVFQTVLDLYSSKRLKEDT